MPASDPPRSRDIAIVGMACLFPGASSVGAYWQNILRRFDAISEVPKERWDIGHFFSQDRQAPDTTYSRWGGFLDPIEFDPLIFGIQPNNLPSIEPLQLLLLQTAREALRDAGLLEKPFPRATTSVVAAVGGPGPLTEKYIIRSNLPALTREPIAQTLPEMNEVSFPGTLGNVAAGRIANRFDLGGMNFAVDAACASSLAALHLGIQELRAGSSDVVLCGTADTSMGPAIYQSFSRVQALSPTGRCRPFDLSADGIAISEGVAVLVLKRLEDARRDKDPIRAIVRGSAGSSDGKGMSLTAPNPTGQKLAMERAYRDAGVDPGSIGLFEAHGTGTVLGDRTELDSVADVLRTAGVTPGSVAIGSVKSMIGHTRAAAGIAGIIKAVLALENATLPPSIHLDRPQVDPDGTPLYAIDSVRPWFSSNESRRAAVSAFGFGGTNFHAVLEAPASTDQRAPHPGYGAELLAFRAADAPTLLQQLDETLQALQRAPRLSLADLAYTLAARARSASGPSVCLLTREVSELGPQLLAARAAVSNGKVDERLAESGVHVGLSPLGSASSVAFLFPGQGSQRVEMLGAFAATFEEVRATFERCAKTTSGRLPRPLLRTVFPPRAINEQGLQAQRADLTRTDMAQPALAIAGMAAAQLLRAFSITPEFTAGHSFGEFVALWQAGILSEEDLLELACARGKFMHEASAETTSGMLAVTAAEEEVRSQLSTVKDWYVANVNAPNQTVISAETKTLDQIADVLSRTTLSSRRLPVACAFHSPLVAAAEKRLAKVLEKMQLGTARCRVYSNSTGDAYPSDSGAIRALLAGHLSRRVDFLAEIRRMYEGGARIFVEVGPGRVLTDLVGRILGKQVPHLAVALEPPDVFGPDALLSLLARLISAGLPVDLSRLFQRREVRTLNLQTVQTTPPRLTYLLDGNSVRPANGAHRPARPPASTSTGEVTAGLGRSPQPAPRSATPDRPSSPARSEPARKEGPSATDPFRDHPSPPRFDQVCVTWALREGSIRPPGTVVITDDKRGIASRLASKLLEEKVEAVIVPENVDLADRSQTEKFVADLVRDHGPLGAIVHLAPIRPKPPFDLQDPAAWAASVRADAKPLLNLCAVGSARLSRSVPRRAMVMSVSGLGGCFGYEPFQPTHVFHPANGAGLGVVKTVCKEWPDVRVRAVDVDPRDNPDLIAARLFDELHADDEEPEIGYVGSRRLRVLDRPSSLRRGRPLVLDRSSVVVLTGGARGVTAEAAKALASRHSPRLLLIGRSPVAGEESEDLRACTTPAALRARLFERARKDPTRPTPWQVEQTCMRILADREVRATLALLRQAGSEVEYHALDARDPQAAQAFVSSVYERYGRLDVLVHGAGIIEDKLVEDKTVDSFDRVFNTKVEGLLNLLRHVRPASLQALAIFSSIAARGGNRGQTDYAAANETMNKLALWLDRTWPGRVVSFDWGPWNKGSMVTPAIREQMNTRGIQLIEPEEGREWFADELIQGRKGDVEIMYGSGYWYTKFIQAEAQGPTASAAPSLKSTARAQVAAPPRRGPAVTKRTVRSD